MKKLINKKTFVAVMLAVTMFFSVLSYGASFASAATANAGATLKLDPSSGAYASGTFNVAIKVDTGGEAINAVKAYLTFPADKLQVVSIDTTGSFITFWAENTHDNTAGTIHLQGGLATPGYTGTDGLIATVTFQVVSSGTANVTFDSTSEVLKNSDSSDILSNTVNGSYVLGNISLVPPSSPQNLAAIANNVQVTLTWQPSTQGTYPIAGYAIYRGTTSGGESSTPIATVDASTTTYTDNSVTNNTTYYYYIKAFDNQTPPNYSVKSNEVSGVLTDTLPPEITISSPANNAVVYESALEISGKVVDKGSGVSKVSIDNSTVSLSADGSFSVTINLKEGSNKIVIAAVDKSGNKSSKTLNITYGKQEPKKEITINLQINNPLMVVNGVQQEIDPGRGTKPVIIPKWGRTVVPIRAIVEALGGTIGWDGSERKVTIQFNGTTIALWIDKPQASVNGVMKWIDEKNHNVKPIIVNSRTMLPLRFVAENLGCTVDWFPETKAITITYGG